MRARRVAWLLALIEACSLFAAQAAVKPGLEGAQELFRQNRWGEARRHLRSQWASIAEKDRPAASFLIGRSHVREAEFYRAARSFGDEAGLAYLGELTAAAASRKVVWIPLFKGLYQVDADRNAEGERTLAPLAQSALPAPWKASARLRRALALHRLGRIPEAAALLKETGPEARFAALLASGRAEPPAASGPGPREKLLTAAVLFRTGRAGEAEALLAGANLDLPDVEDKSAPKKLLRFHDPFVASAWERICWERAVVALTPLAAGAAGTEASLAAYYAGLSLFSLGVPDEAAKLLKGANGPALGPQLQPSARLLLAACGWQGRPPAAAELASLWDGTQGQPDAVLLWDELRRSGFAKLEPFATKLEARLRDLLQSSSAERPSGALVGRWGLARLRHGEGEAALPGALSEYRDKSNKNKLEWNDPLLLLALSAADYRSNQYAQALETLFELSKTFPGLRPLQWNLQGIYAARQTAGGEARIGQ